MAKPPTDSDALEKLRRQILLTLDFVEETEDLGEFGEQIRRLAGDTAVGSRKLRLIARDVSALALALPSHRREGLESILKQRLAVDKDAERSQLSADVARILRRGSIASEKERRRLEEYVDMLSTIGGDPKEISAVTDLLRSG